MKSFKYYPIIILLFTVLKTEKAKCTVIAECYSVNSSFNKNLIPFSKAIVPNLSEKRKGEAGKIGVIGGSVEYTGAPYFAAITALKTGADLVYVITTADSAPVIKIYSPDLIVYPFLSAKYASKINALIQKMDVIIIGPGLGREDDTLELIYNIIATCRELRKPLVIDADGLFAVSKNLSVLENYPSPGVILTPNHKEAERLKQAIHNESNWYHHWYQFVSVLVKGKEDQYLSSSPSLIWTSSEGGSVRRAGGQGDILAGALGTFYNWALKSHLCEDIINRSELIAQSIAAYAAAKFTRKCSSKAYATFGRSMTASDMIKEIHSAVDETFS